MNAIEAASNEGLAQTGRCRSQTVRMHVEKTGRRVMWLLFQRIHVLKLLYFNVLYDIK